MAPASPIPETPMDQIQEMDLKTTYYMIFKHIMKDFVHKDDLRNILAANIVSTAYGGPGKAEFPIETDAAARAKNLGYQAALKVGGIVREEAIESVEAAIGSI